MYICDRIFAFRTKFLLSTVELGEYMPEKKLIKKFKKIQNDLREFIELSINENEDSWKSWININSRNFENKCWSIKGCEEKLCPSYKNKHDRCWISTGTMCGGIVQGKFAKKYTSCKECDVYELMVMKDPITEIQEHIIVLTHSLREKNNELRELSTVDSLTSVYNRRYLDLFLKKEFEKAKRGDIGLAVVLVDVDDFKKINDQFGHISGDHALKIVANSLLQATRKSDILARYGGDEFVVVLNGYIGNIKKSVKKLIKRIEANISHSNSIERTFDIDVSCGFSVYKENMMIDDLFESADKDMYKNKHKNKA
jgi:diguanylate cyclase (GGDEF)-like protein